MKIKNYSTDRNDLVRTYVRRVCRSGLTNKAAAASLGISAATLYRWLDGDPISPKMWEMVKEKVEPAPFVKELVRLGESWGFKNLRDYARETGIEYFRLYNWIVRGTKPFTTTKEEVMFLLNKYEARHPLEGFVPFIPEGMKVDNPQPEGWELAGLLYKAAMQEKNEEFFTRALQKEEWGLEDIFSMSLESAQEIYAEYCADHPALDFKIREVVRIKGEFRNAVVLNVPTHINGSVTVYIGGEIRRYPAAMVSRSRLGQAKTV